MMKSLTGENITPTKRSNAQHLIAYEKQLLYEENEKSGNIMQQPMNSYVYGINTSSESILVRSYLLFARKKTFLSNSGTHILREKVNLTKRENFLTSNLYRRRRNP